MGCDIHVYVEVKDAKGKWKIIEGDGGYDKYKWGVGGRDYHLFGVLAGVRAITILPLFESRGIPTNASSKLSKICKDPDSHSHSYATAKEISDSLNKPVKYKYNISQEHYKSYKKDPSLFDHDALWKINRPWADPKFIIPIEEMDRRLSLEAFINSDESYCVEVIALGGEEKGTYKCVADISQGFFDTFLNKILKLDPDPNNIRTTFWFDN